MAFQSKAIPYEPEVTSGIPETARVLRSNAGETLGGAVAYQQRSKHTGIVISP